MEETMEAMAEPNTPMKETACIKIPKSQAETMKVDQGITYTVVGKITGIHKGYGPKMPNQEEKYSIDVEIEELKTTPNTADSEYKKLKEGM